MSIVNALIGPVSGLLDKFVEDKDQKNALAHEIATMSEKHAQQIALQQIEVLKTERVKESNKLKKIQVKLDKQKQRKNNFDEVEKIFSSNGYSDLRPVHVSIVKRYISYGHVDRYLSGKSFLNPK